jgi:hypothetical protein
MSGTISVQVTPAAVFTTIGLSLRGFVIFYITKVVRKSRDELDISMLSQEIPPE